MHTQIMLTEIKLGEPLIEQVYRLSPAYETL